MKWNKTWDKVKKYFANILLYLLFIVASFCLILDYALFIKNTIVSYKWWAILIISGYLIYGFVKGIIFIFMLYYLIYVWENRKLTGYISYLKSLKETK